MEGEKGCGGIDSYDLLSPTAKDPRAFKIEHRLKLGISSPSFTLLHALATCAGESMSDTGGFQKYSRELVGRSGGYLE